MSAPGAQRLVFAGVDVVLGFVVLGVFAFLFALGGVGLVALFVLGSQGRHPGLLAGGVGLLALVGLLGRLGWRALHRFRSVDIALDGTWTLRGLFGRELTRISPEAGRTVGSRVRDAWLFTGSAHRIRQSIVDITLADGRRWESLRTTAQAQAAALAALHAAGGRS